MTVTQGIHTIKEWLKREVAPNIKLKVPDNEQQTTKYPYKLASPTVYAMYVPLVNNSQPIPIETMPHIIVQMVEGTDLPREHKRDMKVRLHLSVWDTGLHPKDVFNPKGNGLYEQVKQGAFDANEDGWNDAWNLLDMVLRKLRNTEIIGDTIRIKAEDGFTYKPYDDDGVLIDAYPFFFAYIEFSCEMATPPSTRFTDEFL